MSLLKRALSVLFIAGSAAVLVNGASASADTTPPNVVMAQVTPGAKVAGVPVKSNLLAGSLRLGTVYRNAYYRDVIVGDLMTNGETCNGWNFTWQLGSGLAHRNATDTASSVKVTRWKWCNRISLVTRQGIYWSDCLPRFDGIGLPTMGYPFNDNVSTVGLQYDPACGPF